MYADVLLQRVVSEYFVDPVAEVSENGHSAVQRKTFGLDSQCASFGGGKVDRVPNVGVRAVSLERQETVIA